MKRNTNQKHGNSEGCDAANGGSGFGRDKWLYPLPPWVVEILLRLNRSRVRRCTADSPAFMTGAPLGYSFAQRVCSRDQLLKEALPQLTGRGMEPATEIYERSLAACKKLVMLVLSSKPLPYISEFLQGFVHGCGCSNARDSDATPIYRKLLGGQQRVSRFNSLLELYNWLLTELPRNQVGDFERVKKLCSRIRLSFPRRKPARKKSGH